MSWHTGYRAFVFFKSLGKFRYAGVFILSVLAYLNPSTHPLPRPTHQNIFKPILPIIPYILRSNVGMNFMEIFPDHIDVLRFILNEREKLCS